MLLALRFTCDTPRILNVEYAGILELLRQYFVDRNNFPVENRTSHIWKYIITIKDPLRFRDVLMTKFIT